jgi:tetratricopeptide (TPR) repeat protein
MTCTHGDLPRAVQFANNTTRYLARRREVRRLEWTEMGLHAARVLQTTEADTDLYRRSEKLFLNELGSVWDALGEKRKALEYYELKLPIDRELGDRGGEATTLNNIGSAWDALGEKRKALEYYEQALPLSRAVGDRSGEAATLNNTGGVWDDLGEKRKALEYYEQALPLRRAVGDRRGEATTLNNMGGAWDGLGEKRKALEYYEQALPLRRAVGDRSGEAVTCFNIAIRYEDLGDLDKAIEYANRCVELDEQVEHPDLASDRAYLSRLIRKRDGVPEPETTAEDETAQVFAMLAQMYRTQGEDAVRDSLKQSGMPDDTVEQVMEIVKNRAEGEGS